MYMYIYIPYTCIIHAYIVKTFIVTSAPGVSPAESCSSSSDAGAFFMMSWGHSGLSPPEAGDDGASSKATQVPVVVPSLDFRGTHGDLGNLRIEKTYPLVIYDSYGTSPCSIGKSFIHGPFSIVMPKFQRVYIYNRIYIYNYI